jgi:alkylhydroperoxidase/carboxymuconolactone decarboxylase family protein YurZ
MAQLPKRYVDFTKAYPAVARTYEALGTECHGAGPLDDRSRALVKVALAIGARQEGGVHAQVRRARGPALPSDDRISTGNGSNELDRRPPARREKEPA